MEASHLTGRVVGHCYKRFGRGRLEDYRRIARLGDEHNVREAIKIKKIKFIISDKCPFFGQTFLPCFD
jgi:hypothetical protein